MTSLPCNIYNNIALSGFMAKILSASKCGRSKGNGQRDRFVWKWLQNSETNGAVINELLSGYDSRNIFQLFEFAGEKFLFFYGHRYANGNESKLRNMSLSSLELCHEWWVREKQNCLGNPLTGHTFLNPNTVPSSMTFSGTKYTDSCSFDFFIYLSW